MTITATPTQTTLTNETQIKSITLDDGEVIEFTAYVDSLTDINDTLTMSISDASMINPFFTALWSVESGTATLSATDTKTVDVDSDTVGTVQLGLVVNDGATNSSKVTHDIVFSAADELVQDLSSAIFLVNKSVIHGYSGHDNVEVINFEIVGIGKVNNGYFDFTNNLVTKVDVELSDSKNSKTIDSDSANINFKNENLFIRPGAFGYVGFYNVKVTAFTASHPEGIVICGSAEKASTLMAKLY